MNLFYLQLCATVHLSESLAYAGRDLSAFESWGLRRSRKVWRWESIHQVHVIFCNLHNILKILRKPKNILHITFQNMYDMI